MRGRFLRRYKRFLADIETPTGDVITAFCPATGRLKTCYRVGAPVEYTPVENSDRRTHYDWWSIRMPDSWVVIDTRPANELLRQHRSLLSNDLAEGDWQAEPSLAEGGRLDFRVDDNRGTTWIEVKSVTWCERGIGWFPDAPSERAVRHVRALSDLVQSRNNECLVVFMAMRSDIEEIRVAKRVCPDLWKAVREAKESGVRFLGIGSDVNWSSVRPKKPVPVNIKA